MMLEVAVRVASALSPSPSPSPSIPANPYLEAVEEWPDPPGWFFVAVRVIAVIAALAVVIAIALAAASWRTRKASQPVKRKEEWVDLAALDARSAGVERGERGTHVAPPDDTTPDDTAPDNTAPDNAAPDARNS